MQFFKSLALSKTRYIFSTEWLAKFHGLCYIAMQRHMKNVKKEDLPCSESWLEEHPWIRHTRTTTETSNQHSSLSNEIVDSKGIFNTQIPNLTATSILFSLIVIKEC